MVLAACVTWVACTGVARAEDAAPSSAKLAQAEELFHKAKALMGKKDYDKACPMLLESYTLAVAGGTLQNLAICYEEAGLVAFAYERFNELKVLSQKARRADRVKLADAHIAKLLPRLSHIRIHVPPERQVTELKVEVDGAEFGAASWDAGILVNAGAHKVTFSAPGRRPVTLERSVDEGSPVTVEMPALAELPKPVVVAPPPPPPPTATLAELDHISGQRALRTTGFVVGGIGLATLAAGGVFGVLTITTNNAAKATCSGANPAARNTGPYNDPALSISKDGACFAPAPGQPQSTVLTRANGLRDDARTFANVANVLIPVGVVALGIGTYLVVRSSSGAEKLAPGAKKASLQFTPGLGGAALSGTFQ